LGTRQRRAPTPARDESQKYNIPSFMCFFLCHVHSLDFLAIVMFHNFFFNPTGPFFLRSRNLSYLRVRRIFCFVFSKICADKVLVGAHVAKKVASAHPKKLNLVIGAPQKIVGKTFGHQMNGKKLATHPGKKIQNCLAHTQLLRKDCSAHHRNK